jgi:signal transduction histidine kinase
MPNHGSKHSNHEARAEEFLTQLDSLFAAALRSSSGRKSMLQATLDAGMKAVGGRRGFLALVNHETGVLDIACTAGKGWTPERRKMRLHLAQETNRGITGHVALSAKPYVTGDVDTDPYYLRYFPDVKSEVAVPIPGPTGQTRGVINIDSPLPDDFSADDCAHLSAIAQTAAVSLALEGFRSRESALVEIGNNLTTTLDIEVLLRKVVEVAETVLEFEDCSVYLIDEQTDHLVLRASCCLFSDRVGTTSYPVGEGITGWVARNGKSVRLEDPVNDPRWKTVISEMPEEEIGAFLAVPIVSRDNILGVLRVLRRKSHSPWFSNHFTEADERLLTTIASQLGAAIENARSFQKLVRSERMAAWGELSARSAHMIGNRTFALKGDLNELKFLVDSYKEDEHCTEVQGLIKSMENGVERLEEILREFRDYVVATQVTLAEADINTVVEEVVSETFPKRSPIKLLVKLGKNMPSVWCDARRLKRAFSELIENSVSFQPDGGELSISTRLVNHQDRIENRLAHSREYVQIEFADKGPGVPEESKGRIFRPFYTSRVKGMGLGLSIVKGIVEAHQGIIREAGKPGKGARFLVFLPVE